MVNSLLTPQLVEERAYSYFHNSFLEEDESILSVVGGAEPAGEYSDGNSAQVKSPYLEDQH